MKWTVDPATTRYTVAYGIYAATVWNSDRHGFAATLTYRGMVTAQYGFATLEDAQAWCLTNLAELRVSGKCERSITNADD